MAGFLEPEPCQLGVDDPGVSEPKSLLRRITLDVVSDEERLLLSGRVQEVVVDKDPSSRWRKAYW